MGGGWAGRGEHHVSPGDQGPVGLADSELKESALGGVGAGADVLVFVAGAESLVEAREVVVVLADWDHALPGNDNVVSLVVPGVVLLES